MGVPYPGAAANVPVANYSGTVLASGTYSSGIIASRGANVSVWAKVTHAATLHIKQYADAAGAILVQDTTQALVANTLANKSVADGKLFSHLEITIVNSAGASMDITQLSVLQ